MKSTHAFVCLLGALQKAFFRALISQSIPPALTARTSPALHLTFPFVTPSSRALSASGSRAHTKQPLLHSNSTCISPPQLPASASAIVSALCRRSRLCAVSVSPEGDFCGTSAMSWFMVI